MKPKFALARDTQPRNLRLVTICKAILVIGIAVQSYATFETFIHPLGSRIWEVRQLPAIERTTTLSTWISPDEQQFLEFLREQTPPDATLVFFEEHGIFSWWPALQYALYPRHIRSCPNAVETCWEPLLDGNSYLVLIGNHPSLGGLSDPERLVHSPRTPDWAVYRPSQARQSP